MKIIFSLFFSALSESVPYRSSAPSSVASDTSPPYLSRYDRIRWGVKGVSPMDEDQELPGNHVVRDRHLLERQVRVSFRITERVISTVGSTDDILNLT